MSCLKVTPFAKQCFLALTVALSSVGHGVILGFSAILLPELHQETSPIVLSKNADSWIASILSITIPIGSFVVPAIMGPFGRKPAYYIVCILSIIGWIIMFLANSIEALVVGKIAQGIFLGMVLPLSSVMLGEYSSPKNRGAFLTIPSLSQGLGIFFVHFIGSFLTWKNTALVSVLLPLISFIMIIFIPESPSWLAVKGRYEKCKTEFRWLRGYDEDPELEAMIQARKDFEKTKIGGKKLNIIAVIKKKEFYRPIILAVHVYILNLLSGPTLMNAYSIKIINLIMNAGVNADAWMIGLDMQRILTNTMAIYIINKVPRRMITFATGGLCLLSYIAIAVYVFFRNSGILTYQANWLPGMLITVQLFSSAMGIPLISIIAGEVFPLEYRSISDCILMLLGSLSGFIVLKTFVGLVDSFGIAGTYAVYSGLMAYCLVVIWHLMPETKGKTLLQIEEEFSGKMQRLEDLEQRECLKEEER